MSEIIKAGCIVLSLADDSPAPDRTAEDPGKASGVPGGGPSADFSSWRPLDPHLVERYGDLADLCYLQESGFIDACVAQTSDLLVVRVAWRSGRRGDWGAPAGRGSGRGADAAAVRRAREAMGRVLRALKRVWVEDVDEVDDVKWEDAPSVIDEPDLRTTSELYRTLPSPAVRPDELGRVKDRRVRRAIEQLLSGAGLSGMKSRLYRYQANSAARMLLAESAPGRMLDPTFVAVPSPDPGAAPYYLDARRCDVRKVEDVPWYDLPRGGILCEEMGTGKTITSLALILADLDILSLPDPSIHRTQPHTSISTAWTGPSEASALNWPSPWGLTLAWPVEDDTPILEAPLLGAPSLVDSCIHHQRTSWGQRRTRTMMDSIPLSPAMEGKLHVNRPFCLPLPLRWFGLGGNPDLPQSRGSRLQHYNIVRREEMLLLTAATLLVVPSLLMHQWRGEIAKHFEEEAVRVLLIDKDIPSTEEMIEADIVLISDARLRVHATAVIETRNRQSSVSCPLALIRWKRIMVDEGHFASSASNDLVRCLASLSCERKWIISGTPTKHLLGTLSDSVDTVAINQEAVGGGVSPSQHPWTQDSIDDLHRLGTIMAGFLGMQPFISEANFAELVIGPLQRECGALALGGSQRVANLMSAVMVRNRAEDIVAEMPLPMLTTRMVDLDFGYYGAMTYNVLQALIAVNVVTSQGTDVDYLLHKRNVKHLRQALSNLSLASFWFSGDHLDVSGPLFIIDNHLRDRVEKGYTEEECCILVMARNTLDAALQDPIWAELMRQRSLPALSCLKGDDSGLLDAWTPKGLDGKLSGMPILPIEQSLKFCQAYVQVLEDPAADLVNSWRGKMQAAGIVASRSLQTQLASIPGPHHAKHPSASGVGDAQTGLQTGQALLGSAKRSHEKVLQPPSPRKYAIPPSPQLTDRTDTVLPDLTLSFSTMSSKVNWILAEVHRCPLDTFVLFSQDVAVLGYLTEAFDLIGVESCYVGYGIKNREAREESLLLFQDGRARVCLMDLALASRGLNLVVANRVVFTEPVWRKDVEAQAIKRIHRIGQQRPCQAHTLYMRGTQEETMIYRRTTASSRALEDDESLRDSIKRPNFVTPTTAEPIMMDIQLDGGPAATTQSPTPAPVAERQQSATINMPSDTAPRPKRARFA